MVTDNILLLKIDSHHYIPIVATDKIGDGWIPFSHTYREIFQKHRVKAEIGTATSEVIELTLVEVALMFPRFNEVNLEYYKSKGARYLQ